MFEAVDVQRNRSTGHERRIGANGALAALQIKATSKRPGACNADRKCMDHRVQIFVADGRQDLQADALKLI